MRQNQLPPKGETLSLACVAARFVTTFHSTGTVLFFFKLALPKQHSFTLIPLALKARLPSMYHLRRELRFTSTCAYMYVARFTISGKKRVIPLFVVPVHFECTQQQAFYCSVICYQYYNDWFFNVAEKSLVLQNVRKFSFQVTPNKRLRSNEYMSM